MSITIQSDNNTDNTKDTFINDQEGHVKMELGNGDDTYIVENISNGYTEITDASGSGEIRYVEEKYYGYDEEEFAINPYKFEEDTTKGYYASSANTDNILL